MTLEEVKIYLRVNEDEDEEDIFISSLQKAAEIYMKNAGVVVGYEDELYKLAIHMMVLHWYDNRGIVGENKEIPHTLQPIIIQLQHSKVL